MALSGPLLTESKYHYGPGKDYFVCISAYAYAEVGDIVWCHPVTHSNLYNVLHSSNKWALKFADQKVCKRIG